MSPQLINSVWHPSNKRIPEWLSIVCSIQNWGLVCWEATSGVKSRVLCRISSVLLHTRDVLESNSLQQLDRCLAATVWAARCHSNMHHSLSSLAAWKPNQCTAAPGDTDWNRHAKTCLSETSEERQWAEAASDWNVVSNQQSFTDGHGILSVHYCCYEQIDLCFILQGRVRTSVSTDGQFCCSFIANFISVSVCHRLSKYNVVSQSYCKNKKGALFCPTV